MKPNVSLDKRNISNDLGFCVAVKCRQNSDAMPLTTARKQSKSIDGNWPVPP